VSSLQGRLKWRRSQKNLYIGNLVILRDEHTPSYRWKLGRIIELHQGRDELVRVVSIKTANSIVKRAINKLCNLPVNDDDKNYY